MRIAREYSVDVVHHSKISLFDEDIAGLSEAEIRERVDRMVQADLFTVSITRLYVPRSRLYVPIPAGLCDIDTMTDEEIHEKIQGLLDDMRKNKETEK